MANITYETDSGKKIHIKMDEKFINECDALSIKAFQEVINVIREEIKIEEEKAKLLTDKINETSE